MAATLTLTCPACEQPIELTVQFTGSTVRDGNEIHTGRVDFDPIHAHLDKAHPSAQDA